METVIRVNNESEYNEILRQAVAVIETARGNAARAIVSTSNEMHWRIGQLLYERKLDSAHGDGVVKRLSADLKAMYPKMGMSVSNLWAMKKYYVRFHLSDPKLQRCVGVFRPAILIICNHRVMCRPFPLLAEILRKQKS